MIKGSLSIESLCVRNDTERVSLILWALYADINYQTSHNDDILGN